MAKKLSAGAERALSVIAHIAMARNIAKEVEGYQGFDEYYLKKIAAADRAIYARFNDLCRQAYKDLSKMMEQDVKQNGQQHP